MRPVNRGTPPPEYTDRDYRKAAKPLKERIGTYCSFCEREIGHGGHVEHIQPRKPANPAHRIPNPHAWENLLLSCNRCNGKGGKTNAYVSPTALVLPDRDNTFRAFIYDRDCQVRPNPTLPQGQQKLAQALINLVRLNPKTENQTDIDLWAGRREAWMFAKEALDDLRTGRDERTLKLNLELAKSRGFFSIWMTVFTQGIGAGSKTFRHQLITAFPDTARDCFDEFGLPVVTPRPPNGLPGAGKV